LLLASGLLFVAAAFVAPSAPSAQALTDCEVSDHSLDGTEMAFLDLINEYRTSNGLNALTVSTNLNRAAHWMANDLGTNAYFSHTDSLGRSPYARAQDCGYPAGAGENLAAGTAWSSAQSAFTAWQNSPGHNANMLNGFYRQIGIARLNVPGSPYGWYWVTNFGATDDGTGGPAPTSTPTQQPEPTSTPTQQAQPTNTPVPQPTSTPTPAPTQASPTPTATTPPGSTPTPVATSTPTPTPTPSGSQGFSPPPTATPTATPSQTPGSSPTASPTARPSSTPAPSATPAGTLALQPGTNLIGWTGATAHPSEALKHVKDDVSVVYGYDHATGTWLRYAPGLPSFVNTLSLMKTGDAYWIFMK